MSKILNYEKSDSMVILNFNKFIVESNDDNLVLKVRDIISKPIELDDIFEVFSNEIKLLENSEKVPTGFYDSLVIEFYSQLYLNCLLQHFGLTDGYVDMISSVRNFIKMSNSDLKVRNQYKMITRPSHEFSADLLKMLTDYKTLEFVDDKLKKYSVMDLCFKLVRSMFTGNSHYSKTFKEQLLRSKILVS